MDRQGGRVTNAVVAQPTFTGAPEQPGQLTR